MFRGGIGKTVNKQRIVYNQKISLESTFTLFRHIDANEPKYIKRLADVVAIKSVSAWPDNRPDVVRMIEWTKQVCIVL